MKYVVGGGISALVWSFYNSEYQIVSEDLGGQLSSPWMGPRLLNDTPDNRQLLEDLDCSTESLVSHIGYIANGNLASSCTGEMRREYYKKSRALSGDEVIPQSVMSGGADRILHLQVDWERVLEKLIDRGGAIIRSNVTSLDRNLINGSMEYTSLIWTPPLPLLLRLLGLGGNLRSCQKLFLALENFADFSMGAYDYVYVPGPEFSYHRVTRTPNGFVLEWTGNDLEETKEEMCKVYSIDPEGKRCAHLKHGQIVSVPENEVPVGRISNKVRLLGRYAQWDHSIKIENVVSLAQKG